MAKKGKNTPKLTPLKSPVSNGRNTSFGKVLASGDESSPEKNTKASKLEQMLKNSAMNASPVDIKMGTKVGGALSLNGKSNLTKGRKQIDIKKKIITDLSESDLDSDFDINEESDDGIMYAEDMDESLSGEDFDDAVEDEEVSGEDFEMDSITDEDEEVPQLIPASDNEDGDIVVKVVDRLDKENPRKFEMVTQGRVAVKALTDKEQKKSKKHLFGDQNTKVYLHARYKLPAYPKQKQASRAYFELPFSEKNVENSSICLILPDLYHTKKDKTDPDVDKQAREWFEIFREKFGLTGRDISKIYTLNQLKREVHTQQDKRKLMETYDIILIDRTILPITLFHLEKWAQRGTKMPLPFNVAKKDVPEQIRRAYKLSYMDLRPGIDDVTIRIGNLSQSGSHIAANFVSAVECLFKNVPGGELNIKTVDIRTDQSQVVLPIYVDFTPKKDVEMPKPFIPKSDSYVEDLDTLPMGYKIKFDGIDFKVVNEQGKEIDYWENDEADPLDDLPNPKPFELKKEQRKQNIMKRIKDKTIDKKQINNIVKALKYYKRKRAAQLEEKPIMEAKANKKEHKAEPVKSAKQSIGKKIKSDEVVPTKKRKLDKMEAKSGEIKPAKEANQVKSGQVKLSNTSKNTVEQKQAKKCVPLLKTKIVDKSSGLSKNKK